jgi:site-specific DNA recombinase
MLADLADGVIDAVVVYDLDRLYRQPRELEEFFDMCEAAGVTGLRR